MTEDEPGLVSMKHASLIIWEQGIDNSSVMSAHLLYDFSYQAWSV